MCSLIQDDKRGFWEAENTEQSPFLLENQMVVPTQVTPPPLHRLINLGGMKSQLASHIIQVCLFSSKQAAFRRKASLSLPETQIECSIGRRAPSCQPPAASDCIFTFINDLCEADVVTLTLEMRTLKLAEVK